MKAIFVKELQENARWAGLLCLLAIGAMTYVLDAVPPFMSMYPDVGQNLGFIGIPVQAVTMFGFPAIGFGLGMLQVLQDARVGRWAFVSHRPISRGRIFLAKTLAGLTMYSLAAGVPVALGITLAITPGRIAAPFEWHMVAPALVDVLMGIVWYFAGVLCAARQARWFGSRLFPAGLAFFVSVLAAGVAMTVGQALLILIGGLIVFVPAAIGAYVAGGLFERQPWPARLLQTMCVACGVGLFVAAICAVGYECLRVVILPEQQHVFENYQVDKNGRVLRARQGMRGDVEVMDLEGRPIHFDRNQFWQFQLPVAHLWISVEGYRFNYRNPLKHVVFQPSTGNLWYYVNHRRVLEGFDQTRRRFIGSIGVDGFAAPGQAAQPFPESTECNPSGLLVMLTAAGTLFKVDLTTYQVHKLIDLPSSERIIAAATFIQATPDTQTTIAPNDTYFAIATRSTLHVLQMKGEMFRFPLPKGPDPGYYLQVGRTLGGNFMIMKADGYDWSASREVIETDEKGTVLARKQLPAQNRTRFTKPAWADALEMVAIPPVLLLIAAAMREMVPQLEVVSAVAAGMGILCGCIGWIITSRAAFPLRTKLLWTAICVLTSIGGVLTLFVMRNFPARVKCNGCGRRRPVDLEHCPHCEAAFAKPSHEGIEVLEPVLS